MRNPEDEFTSKTKDRLAKRVGYACSFPGCGAPTVGPSDEKADAVASIGEAAHIAGASKGPGSRRYDKNMTSEERSEISNGIWLCRTHGKLVDSDEVAYTAAELKTWKFSAELRAKHNLGWYAPRVAARPRLSLTIDEVRREDPTHDYSQVWFRLTNVGEVLAELPVVVVSLPQNVSAAPIGGGWIEEQQRELFEEGGRIGSTRPGVFPDIHPGLAVAFYGVRLPLIHFPVGATVSLRYRVYAKSMPALDGVLEAIIGAFVHGS